MAVALVSGNKLTSTQCLLEPAIREAMAYAGKNVKNASLFVDFSEDDINLRVTHRLFSRSEIDDGSFKLSFRSRVARALQADQMPNGRHLVVERRSFLARAARIRKSKPKKVMPR